MLGPWPDLLGTRVEVETLAGIADRLPGGSSALVLTGARATEERVVAELPRFGTVHLATHGFFEPEELPSMAAALDEERSAGGAGAFEPEPRPRRLQGLPPRLLSGLVLAGADAPPEEGRDDGLLTAEELSWLDLSRVRLFVLSACETGLGNPRGAEGMLGLRRTLHLAGVDTVVSSLWQVPDEPTARLMERFYRNLWEEGLGALAALRAAQLEALEQNRRLHGDARPGEWGAFAVSGDWR